MQPRSAETSDLQNQKQAGTNPIIEGVLDARALASEMERSQGVGSSDSPTTEVPSDVSELINDSIKDMVDSPSDISPMLSPAKPASRGKRAQTIDSSLILQGSRSRRPPEKYVANVNEDESGEDQTNRFDQLNDSYSNWMLKKQQKQDKKRKRVSSNE